MNGGGVCCLRRFEFKLFRLDVTEAYDSERRRAPDVRFLNLLHWVWLGPDL